MGRKLTRDNLRAGRGLTNSEPFSRRPNVRRSQTNKDNPGVGRGLTKENEDNSAAAARRETPALPRLAAAAAAVFLHVGWLDLITVGRQSFENQEPLGHAASHSSHAQLLEKVIRYDELDAPRRRSCGIRDGAFR